MRDFLVAVLGILIVYALAFGAFYLAGAFISLEPDLSVWTDWARALVLALSAFFTAGWLFAVTQRGK